MKILKQKDGIYFCKIEIAIGSTEHITNTYVIYNKEKMDEAILFDPADKADEIVKKLDKEGITLRSIFITHCHGDHIYALEKIYNIYKSRKVNLKVYVHKNDANGLKDDNKNYLSILGLEKINLKNIDITKIEDKQIIKGANVDIEVIHTPGHTNGSVIFYIPTLNILITGDTIFSNCYGRVDLESGSIEDMKNSISKTFDRFDDIQIYPGHGDSAVLGNIKKTINILLSIRQ